MIHSAVLSHSLMPLRTTGKVVSLADPRKEAKSLCESTLFSGLHSQASAEILLLARSKTFAPDDVLFSQGQNSDKWILIQTGTVKMTQVSVEGNEVIVWLHRAGEMIGVLAGNSGGRYTCTAAAVDRCRILVWDSGAVQVIIGRYPQIQANIASILETRLTELEERFCEIASQDVASRLALLLSRLCRSAEKKGGDGFEVRIRRVELAQMIGTTLFTVSRILSRWASMGLVIAYRAGIIVRDPDRLVASSSKKICTALCGKAS